MGYDVWPLNHEARPEYILAVSGSLLVDRDFEDWEMVMV